ncbi:MAG: c-type cytochrome [Candidatus Marinimicrobia bacterium]|nr:c-type cytochrome [Candidatus Neomarinimicrobiota bacterium]
MTIIKSPGLFIYKSRYTLLIVCFSHLLHPYYGIDAQPEGSRAHGIISLTNIEFIPNRVKIGVGDTLTFVNKDKFDHDVYIVRTANLNEVLFPATTIPSGGSTKVIIEEEGLFNLYCTIHGGMIGKITTTGSFELTEEEKQRAARKKVLPPIVKAGEELFWGTAQCYQCHKIGDRGDALRGPSLSDIGFRARIRAGILGLGSATEYLVQSILEPQAHVVEGYTNAMPKVYQPPVDLHEEELKAVVTYLQSQGGNVDTWEINIDRQKLDTEPSMNPFRNGDPQRGETVFKDAGCNSCHIVGDQKAVSPGPELTEIGAYRNWTWLAESVIDPNAEIGANWKNADVYLKIGEMVTGILRKNTDEEIKLLVSQDHLRTFSGDEIERVEIDESTKMPNYRFLTFEQISDLISYLQTLRGDTK